MKINTLKAINKLSLVIVLLITAGFFGGCASATDITTRTGKGSALTHAELDANFDIGAQAKTTSYAIAATDNRDTIEFDGASLTATLPDATTVIGATDTGDFEITVINLNASDLTVARTGSDTIDAVAADYTIAQYEAATFKVNNAADGWNVISSDFHTFSSITAGTAAISGGTIDNTVIGGTTPAAGTFTTGTFTTGTFTTGTIATADINGGTIDGVTIGASAAPTVTNLGTVTTADINGGTIDGVTIGGTTTAAGSFTTLSASGASSLAGGSSTGTWSDLGSVTTVDINGGTLDGVTIGGTTPGAGSFSSLTVSALDNTPIGGTTPSSGAFTTLSATGAIDFNSGAIDGVTIGGTTPAAGTFTTGTIATADINGGAIDGTAIGGSVASHADFTYLTISSYLLSTRSCNTGYTRVGPNDCQKDDASTSTGLTRDSCTAVLLPGTAKTARIRLRAFANSNAATGSRSAAVVAYTDSSCTTANTQGMAAADAYEFSSVTAGTNLAEDVNTVTVRNATGWTYLKLTDDAGNQGQGDYAIEAYQD